MLRRIWRPSALDPELALLWEIRSDPAAARRSPRIMERIMSLVLEDNMAALRRVGKALRGEPKRRGRPRKRLPTPLHLALVHAARQARFKALRERTARSAKKTREALREEGYPEDVIAAVLAGRYAPAASLTLLRDHGCQEQTLKKALAKGRRALQAQRDTLAKLLSLEPWMVDAIPYQLEVEQVSLQTLAEELLGPFGTLPHPDSP